MYDLKNKQILVTGGSRGIGAGIVKYLAECGAQIAFTYASRSEAAQKVLENLKNSSKHKIYSLDINNEHHIEKTFKQILVDFPDLEALVNNAGVTADQILVKLKTEDFDRVIQTNLRGSFLCTKQLLKHMMKNRRGSFVHITSVIGQMGQKGQANYAASKAGIEAFSKSVAQEMASRGIRSNCIAPGFISTNMTDSMDEKQRESITQKIPLSRLGTPEDIAKTCAFLISDDSSYITGQTLSVNGGLYM